METFRNWLNLMCHSRFFLFLFVVEKVLSRFSLVRRLSSCVSDIGERTFFWLMSYPARQEPLADSVALEDQPTVNLEDWEQASGLTVG